tara:strand:+ start:35625 stop:36161 length:537 start_codon:yes stop_codon:yes gene_type:complete
VLQTILEWKMIEQKKGVSASSIEGHVYKVFPSDLNAHYSVFGGLVMATCDRLALVVAERHSGFPCVTASVDSMHFRAPAKDGDTLIFKAAANRVFKTSMEIGIKVMAENSYTGDERHIVSAYFTFVALDEDRHPVEVADVEPATPDEVRRYHNAEIRRSARLDTRQQLKVGAQLTRQQ